MWMPTLMLDAYALSYRTRYQAADAVSAAQILYGCVPDPLTALRGLAEAGVANLTDAATDLVNALRSANDFAASMNRITTSQGESAANVEATKRGILALADGYGVSPDFQRVYNGQPVRRGRDVAYQVTDEIHVHYLTPPHCNGPCCYRAPQPAVAPEMMRQIVQAAAAHPRFTTPAPPPRICFAPPGTRPHDDAFTMVDGISSIRMGGRTARMQATGADATSAGAHVHRVSTKDGTHCLNGQCQF